MAGDALHLYLLNNQQQAKRCDPASPRLLLSKQMTVHRTLRHSSSRYSKSADHLCAAILRWISVRSL